MHKINILPETLAAAAKRRGGRQYAFPQLDASKTALLVIDMQVYFMEPGMAAEVPAARDIVPNINRLAKSLRSKSGQIVWIKSTMDQSTCESWSVMMHELFSRERREAMLENLRAGSAGHQLWPDFELSDEDWILEKKRFSALIQGSSDLEEKLKAAGIDTVIITGTLTDVCCESTARDAMMLNFKTIVVSDANAAGCDDDHNHSLNALARLWSDVVSTDDVISRISNGHADAETGSS
jgi:ureidoacrylate peracid hydrolase